MPPSSLPTHLAQLSTPSLEGEVISTRTTQMKVSGDVASSLLKFIFGVILFPFRPVMVLLAWVFGGRKTPERQTVYIIRIQRPDMTQADVRIEQDIKEAPMEKGDYVSLWGSNRRGVLVVKQGYNHTTRSEIKQQIKMNLILNAIILIIVIFCLLCIGVWLANLFSY